ncbi:MAG: hypothetical protein HY268_33640 [Deltaproteobacteria bacterium]|nr:hypothetical protein [Deltaproteobacteria bacterium]
MPIPVQQRSPLSTQRAFVVHLGPTVNATRRRFQGRVEHLASGRICHFASLKELLQFFTDVAAAAMPPRDKQGREQVAVPYRSPGTVKGDRLSHPTGTERSTRETNS